MNDTSLQIKARFNAMLMQRSGEERLRMGCSMADAAKAVVRSSILNGNSGITPEKLRWKIFLRFYGAEFNDSQKENISKAII